jgi:hypothetical protein
MGSKAQFNVEFFTVLILFVGFAAFFSLKLIEVRPAYIAEVEQAIIRSETYRMGEVMINDPGYPVNWETFVGTPQEDDIKRVGLLDHLRNKTNFISAEKLTELEILCNNGLNYAKVKSLIGAEHEFSLMVVEKPSGLVLLDCGSSTGGGGISSIKRLVAFDSGDDGEFEYGELIVQMW